MKLMKMLGLKRCNVTGSVNQKDGSLISSWRLVLDILKI